MCASPALDLLVQSAAHQPDCGTANDKDEPQVIAKLDLQSS